jgi:PhzF family phenazine biosynthesis protein
MPWTVRPGQAYPAGGRKCDGTSPALPSYNEGDLPEPPGSMARGRRAATARRGDALSMASGKLHRLSAFTLTATGGNPAGVWIGDELPDPETMQRIAAEVGFSETAFIAPAGGADRVARYYSPLAEVSFCGHATIAAGIALGDAEGDGSYRLSTAVGLVPVSVRTRRGLREASLTSVDPRYTIPSHRLLTAALAALGWTQADLDSSIPPARAYAGAWHLVLAAAQHSRLATLSYEFDALKALMLRDGLTTLQLIWRERDDMFHSRNPFPVGGVVEDPATGAAAAALGGYLREARLIVPPVTITIRQGEVMGRPSRITVEIPVSGGITVTGTAVPM